MALTGREVHLVARPRGTPRHDDFAMVERDVAEPKDDEVVVRNVVMSVDPYMRGRMDDRPSYVPPFRLNEPLTGAAVGEVVDPGGSGLARGTLVLHDLGWRDYAVISAARVRRIDADLARPSAYLGVLGMPGMTAYVGLLDVADMTQGDAVFVSAAAGAVGSLAGQIARLRGASRVIGSVGSPEKVRYVTEQLGFDTAFDYHAGPVVEQLRAAAPEGIDVYYDNVGGEQLDAALSALNRFGRVAVCGLISQYNATERPSGPGDISRVLTKRLTIRGFIVADHGDRWAEFQRDMAAWVRDGKIRFAETQVDGLDNAVDAFLGLFSGTNTGKMVVNLAE